MSEMFSCFKKFSSTTIDALSNNLLVSVFTQFGTELKSFYGYKRIYNFFEGVFLDEQHDVTISWLLSENSNKTLAFYLPWKCGLRVRTDKLAKIICSMS